MLLLCLVQMVAQNNDPRQIACSSTLIDFDAGLGASVGAGLGVCITGDQSDPIYYEISLGAGAGVEAGGISLCITSAF